MDTATVYEGVLKPENIAIHVLQNFVNFVASTFAWALLLHFYNAVSAATELSQTLLTVAQQGSSRRGGRVRRHSRIPPGWGESDNIIASIAAAATTFQGR